jgi:signal transduction histidine kinase
MIDQSQKVLADNSIKGEQQLVALINSTISHEMRNPLNVVINQCKIIKILCDQFMDKLKEREGEIMGRAYLVITEFFESIKKSNTICSNSSEILTLNIEDLLSLAHLKSQSFFKSDFSFNLNKTIDEVVKLQQHQTDSKKLEIATNYFDFP